MERTYLSVVCAIILKNKQVLAVKRSENQSLAGYWEFPGGKIEEDETEKTAIIREIEEELCIRVVPIMILSPVWWQGTKGLIQLVPVVCEWPEGEITLQEHAEFRWLAIKDLHLMKWAPADVSVVKQVAELMDQF